MSQVNRANQAEFLDMVMTILSHLRNGAIVCDPPHTPTNTMKLADPVPCDLPCEFRQRCIERAYAMFINDLVPALMQLGLLGQAQDDLRLRNLLDKAAVLQKKVIQCTHA
jgi:hypothetical protein